MAAGGSSEASPVTFSLVRARDALWRLTVSTVRVCMHNRVTGLAAEAAFFAVLSLPPLIFALAGSLGYVFARFSDTQVSEVRSAVLHLPEPPPTPHTVNRTHEPATDDAPAVRRPPPTGRVPTAASLCCKGRRSDVTRAGWEPLRPVASSVVAHTS